MDMGGACWFYNADDGPGARSRIRGVKAHQFSTGRMRGPKLVGVGISTAFHSPLPTVGIRVCVVLAAGCWLHRRTHQLFCRE